MLLALFLLQLIFNLVRVCGSRVHAIPRPNPLMRPPPRPAIGSGRATPTTSTVRFGQEPTNFQAHLVPRSGGWDTSRVPFVMSFVGKQAGDTIAGAAKECRRGFIEAPQSFPSLIRWVAHYTQTMVCAVSFLTLVVALRFRLRQHTTGATKAPAIDFGICNDSPRASSAFAPSEGVATRKDGQTSADSGIPSDAGDLTRAVSSPALAVLAALSLPVTSACADDALFPMPSLSQQVWQPYEEGSQEPQAEHELRQYLLEKFYPFQRMTYSRLLQIIDGDFAARVDFYDNGRFVAVTVKPQGAVNPSGSPEVEDRQSVDEDSEYDQSHDFGEIVVCELPRTTPGLVEKLRAHNVVIKVHVARVYGLSNTDILGIFGLELIVVGALFYMRMRSFGLFGLLGLKEGPKVVVTPNTGVKFDDVAGINEAKQELVEIVSFLQDARRFEKIGAILPKGVLLSGPPGTGKTLMAKAVAGEAGVPFIQASAAELIEMFVGVGSARIRNIFKQARENAPCIIFIDEIDAIGRQRGKGGTGRDELEQVLNQLLTEMDGFQDNSGIIVIAATNRPDILDNALLRPGRFDRRVDLNLPDIRGREEILNVHIRNKPLDDDVSIRNVASRTAGFSGADLENLMNESAILAARRKQRTICAKDVDDAIDRVIAGIAGRSLADSTSKKMFAYYEAGNALVATLLPHHEPVKKVTLIPRGRRKGQTWFIPQDDQSLTSANTLKARIAGALGGRAAERLVFGHNMITTGAGNHLKDVERMARGMVTQFGMSEVGSIAIDDGGFTGPRYSETLAAEIDDAIRAISDEGYATASDLLRSNRALLDKVADELLKVETMSGDRLREIVAEDVDIPEKIAAV